MFGGAVLGLGHSRYEALLGRWIWSVVVGRSGGGAQLPYPPQVAGRGVGSGPSVLSLWPSSPHCLTGEVVPGTGVRCHPCHSMTVNTTHPTVGPRFCSEGLRLCRVEPRMSPKIAGEKGGTQFPK